MKIKDKLDWAGSLLCIVYFLEEIWYLRKNTKQYVVARSSVEGQLIWLKQLLKQLQFEEAKSTTLI